MRFARPYDPPWRKFVRLIHVAGFFKLSGLRRHRDCDAATNLFGQFLSRNERRLE